MQKETHVKSVSITSFVDYQKQLDEFTCGNPTMDDFLRRRAEALTINSETSTAGFFNEEEELVGFYSLSASVISIKNIYVAKKFAGLSESAAYLEKEVSYPAIKLDFLAVNKKKQRKHYGSLMIRRIFVGLYLAQLLGNIGFVALILDSTAEAVEFYERLGFEELKEITMVTEEDVYPMFIRMDTITKIVDNISLPDNPYDLLK